MIVVSISRQLEHTPSLIDLQHADDVGSPRTTQSAEAVGTTLEGGTVENAASTEVIQIALMVGRRIFQRNRTRHAVAELSRVGQLIDGGDVAAAADETVEVVARIVDPGGIERRLVLPIVNPANWMNAW